MAHEQRRTRAAGSMHGARWREWHRRHEREIDGFADHLAALPYLGLTHSTGRRLRELVHAMRPSRIEESEWWRGRCPDGERRFTSKDLLPPPPPGPRAEGRFNHFGQSVFYLSSAPEVASAETVPAGERCESVWIQEFRIAGLDGVLDLAGPEWWQEPGHPLLALALIERVRAPAPDRGRPWKPEYFVPRFVADCAKEAGFRAIRVESSRHEGTNLTLFDWSSCRVDPIGAPQRMEPPQ